MHLDFIGTDREAGYYDNDQIKSSGGKHIDQGCKLWDYTGVSNLSWQQKLVVGVFYRQPISITEQVEQLELAIEQVIHKFRNNNNITYVLGGDFNMGDFDWDRADVVPDSDQRTVNQRVFDILKKQLNTKNMSIYNPVWVYIYIYIYICVCVWSHPSAPQPYTGE